MRAAGSAIYVLARSHSRLGRSVFVVRKPRFEGSLYERMLAHTFSPP
jgi:hypothetical protein